MVYRRIRDLREDNDKPKRQWQIICMSIRRHIRVTRQVKYRFPVEALVKLADYYDVSIDYLLNRTDMKSVNKEA